MDADDDDTVGPHVAVRLAEVGLSGSTKRRVKGVKLECDSCVATLQVEPSEAQRNLVHVAYANVLIKLAGKAWHDKGCERAKKSGKKSTTA